MAKQEFKTEMFKILWKFDFKTIKNNPLWSLNTSNLTFDDFLEDIIWKYEFLGKGPTVRRPRIQEVYGGIPCAPFRTAFPCLSQWQSRHSIQRLITPHKRTYPMLWGIQQSKLPGRRLDNRTPTDTLMQSVEDKNVTHHSRANYAFSKCSLVPKYAPTGGTAKTLVIKLDHYPCSEKRPWVFRKWFRIAIYAFCSLLRVESFVGERKSLL